ncbi:MAG: flagellar biosynthesis regulator FlaF [Pseudomonadota bacterium]
MDPARRARANYGAPEASTKSPRQMEYQAFAQITRDLRQAALRGREDFPRLAEALHLNLRLWSVIATDVADERNGLPDLLRARLVYLSEFTRAHTRKVLDGDETPEALIDINMAVMRGLSQKQDSATCPA